MRDSIDDGALEYAANTAIKRYPYFAIRAERDGNTYKTVKNDLPVKVYKEEQIYPLGSQEVNYHMIALSYTENKISFHVSHVITDGAGIYPFIKTVLYYYVKKQQEKLNIIMNAPTFKQRKKVASEMALSDSINNTFSISYVGKYDLGGDIGKYIKEEFNATDGSTYGRFFIEVMALGGYFDIAFLQGFSNDIYFRAFLKQIEKCGLKYIICKESDKISADVVLP